MNAQSASEGREGRGQRPSALDVAMARVCRNCPVCRQARRRQAGWAYEVVRSVEGRVCPFCRAYERVYGKAAHEA